MIVPDFPLEERAGFFSLCQEEGGDLISLISSNSGKRIPQLLQKGSGFVDYISSYGVTGVRDHFSEDISHFLQEVKNQADIPVAVGFGISTPEARKDMEKIANGVIVGSAIVHKIGECQGDPVVVQNFIEYLKS